MAEPQAPEPSLGAKATKAAGWSIAERWIARALSLVTFALLGRFLAPDDFGLVAMATVFILFFNLFTEGTISQAVIQFEDHSREMLDSAFWLAAVCGTLLFAICAGTAPLIANQIYDEPALAPVLATLGLSLFFAGLNTVQSAILQREFRFKELAFRRFAAIVCGSLVGITWAIVAPSAWAIVAQGVTNTLVTTLVTWKVADYRPGFSATRANVRRLTGFGTQLIGIRLLGLISEQGDTLTVGVLLGKRETGYYAVGFRIYQLVNDVVAGALSAVALSTLSRMQNDLPRLRAAFLRATRTCAIAAIPFFCGLAAIAPDVIPFIFGDKWQPSVPVTQVLCLLGILNCVIFFDRTVLIAVGRLRLELGIVSAAMVANVIVFIIGAKLGGILGVAIATTARSYAFWPLRMWALHRATGLSPITYLKQWLKPALSGAAMFGAMIGIDQLNPPFEPIVMGGVGVLVYLAVLVTLAPEQVRELRDLASSLYDKRRN